MNAQLSSIANEALGASGLEYVLDLLAERIAQRLLELQAAQPTQPPAEMSPWLSIDTAAAYLDWPKQRLYKLTAQAAIPHYKHEGRLLFHRAELDHWLHQFAQPTTRLDLDADQSYGSTNGRRLESATGREEAR